MKTLFHVAPLLLEAGSIIKPGNWGRILNSYKLQQGNPWILAREFIFESVRTANYPSLPSRLSSSFAFEKLEDANQYKSHFASWSSVYEVEFVDPDAIAHRGSYDLASLPSEQVEFVPVVASNAEKYWTGKEIQTAEIISKSSLRIISLVSSGPRTYQP